FFIDPVSYGDRYTLLSMIGDEIHRTLNRIEIAFAVGIYNETRGICMRRFLDRLGQKGPTTSRDAGQILVRKHFAIDLDIIRLAIAKHVVMRMDGRRVAVN